MTSVISPGSRILAYHGTDRMFDCFKDQSAMRSGSDSGQLGHFFSADPKIAAHFTLNEEVLDAGYETEEGSRSLRDPYRFSADPFVPGAQVIQAELILGRCHHMSAVAWMEWLDTIHSGTVAQGEPLRWRQTLMDQGYDSLVINAWDGHSRDADGVRPSLETDATTWVVFEAAKIVIRGRQPAAEVFMVPKLRRLLRR